MNKNKTIKKAIEDLKYPKTSLEKNFRGKKDLTLTSVGWKYMNM